MAYNKGWKITDDPCAFSNATRLIVILITENLVKFCQNVFCFFKTWFWIGQYDPFHTKSDKFYFVFKEFCCLWVLSPLSTNLKCFMDAFIKNEFTASIKKMERWPRNTQNVIFLFYFWVENMLKVSKHMGLSFKSHFKHFILKVAVWLRDITPVPSKHRQRCFGSNTVIFFFFLLFMIF